MTPDTRSSSSIKGTPLTYTDIDSNFKLIDLDLDGLKDGTKVADGVIGSAKLANTAVTAGTYGTSTKVPSIVFNAKGQATGATETDIAFPIVNQVAAVYRLNANISSTIPLDDTIPQITEGSEILTVTITPKSATNRLVFKVTGYGSMTATGTIVAAVFRDSTANALAASATYVSAANNLVKVLIEDEVVAGSTSATTFRLRVGPDASNTLRFNGTGAARYFGGVSGLYLEVMEVKA